MDELKKGDIVRNRYAGDGNPNRYLLYIGKSTVKHGGCSNKGYHCRNYAGEKVKFFQKDEDTLEYIGHMDEFDQLLLALKRLKNMEQEG